MCVILLKYRIREKASCAYQGINSMLVMTANKMKSVKQERDHGLDNVFVSESLPVSLILETGRC